MNYYYIPLPFRSTLYLTFLLVSASLFMPGLLFAGDLSILSVQQSSEHTEHLELLASAIQSGYVVTYPTFNESDFRVKAQQGLDFMRPGAVIGSLVLDDVYEWSVSGEAALRSYFWNIYEDDIALSEYDWRDSILGEWRDEEARFGYMSWEIVHNGESLPVTSIAVFNRNWEVLYDTELVNFIVSATEIGTKTIIQEDNEIQSHASLQSSRTMTVTLPSYRLEGVFGRAVTLNWRVRGTAEVHPYVTASTNDAKFNFATNQIDCWRSNPTTLPPGGNPMVYFGKDGEYANLYSNATPFKSTIAFSNPQDHFFTGSYGVSGNNGRIWSFSFDFSVSVSGGGVGAGIGITPQQNTPDFTLSADNANAIIFNNYTYHHLLSNSYRAYFYDGGSLNLSNFNIRTGQEGPEVGTIHFTLPVQRGYTYSGVLYLFNEWNNPPRTMNFSPQFLRGDAILQPSYQMTSSNYSIEVGQIDTITVTVYNNSAWVDLKGGSVSLNTASLGDRLTILSPATLDIGTIQTSKEFKFVVQGVTPGVVTPQANISAMGWESPVPPSIMINNIVSIESNIHVFTLTEQDVNALTAIFESTNGGDWEHNDNWLTDNPVNTWHGITVKDGQISRLDLGFNNLTGSIPEKIGDLTKLEIIDLPGNGLTGTIPGTIGNLTNLKHFSIWNNQISGSIPVSLGNLSKLEYLQLDINELTGPVPPELGELSNLKHFLIAWNELSGSLPEEIGNLINLRKIDVNRNQLEGPLPSSLQDLGSLETFLFHDTQLCEPPDTAFQAWILSVSEVSSTGLMCPLTSVDKLSLLNPERYELIQNYPNPFNPSTTIRYGLPERSFVTLAVFNSLGQKVALLVHEEHEAGTYTLNFDASHLPSGMYIYRITAGTFVESKRMLFVK